MLRRMSFYALSSKPLLKAKLSANKEREKKEFFVPLPNSITTTEKSLRRELKGIQICLWYGRCWWWGVSDGMGLL
ncbi:hypothetical protein ES332_A05G328100v1 [Gossypium tomentosum]|uniref:Uncharacterized protein n=1 Tax=Gossypium tomentosum TaxID=34277 RepID=A0A5D2QNB8_GOSTO|nr:hypothetical protein ES332_A05G328100v1 [Gossypium tomentosum]